MSVPNPQDPGEVKKSPSGRIPQWAVDEALGVDNEPVPFRGATGKSMLEDAGEGLGSSMGKYSGGLMTAMMVAGSIALALAIIAVLVL